MALHKDGLDPRKTSENPSELDRLREEAEAEQEQGLWGEQALKINEAIVDLAPDDMEAVVRLGRCVQGAGRPCEALELFDRALAADPQDNVALELRGAAASDCALEQRVRSILEEGGLEALRVAADSAGSSVNELRFAVLARQAVVEQDPSPGSIGDLASALVDKGELHTAGPLFRRSLVADPDPRTNGSSMLGYVELLREQSRTSEAIAVCETILAALPDDVDALMAITELTCDLAETERKHEPLTVANAYADRIWAQGIQDESVSALYDRMKEIYARL
jgi:tetratricopeptide (TPR) repeat protein